MANSIQNRSGNDYLQEQLESQRRSATQSTLNDRLDARLDAMASTASNSIAAATSSTALSGLTQGPFSGFVSQREVDEANEKSQAYLNHLVDLCGRLEDAGNFEFISDDKDLLNWWSEFKALELVRIKVNKENFDAAVMDALETKKRLRYYVKYKLDEHLDDDDHAFFDRKISSYKHKLGDIYDKNPGVEEEVTKRGTGNQQSL